VIRLDTPFKRAHTAACLRVKKELRIYFVMWKGLFESFCTQELQIDEATAARRGSLIVPASPMKAISRAIPWTACNLDSIGSF
jgi:hypothetical protein